MERDCSVRLVRGKPDTAGKDWERAYIRPAPGQVYRNRNGQDYRCITALSGHDAILERVSDHWTLIAHGVQQYRDGSIEWDYSTGGRWERGLCL